LQKAALLSGVTAALLAGGLGTRLRPVSSDRPKALAEIHGRPFLAYLLDQLSVAGLHSVIVCTGYLGDQIERAFGDTYGPLRLSYSRELRALGTAGALRLALPKVKSDTVLVMNGDSFCAVDLTQFWIWHSTRNSSATMLLTQVSDSRRFGSVKVDQDGAVIEFAEKRNKDLSCWINAGVYLINRQVIDSIPAETNRSLEYDVFPQLVGRGLCGYAIKERFLDIGTPQGYTAAKDFFAP
jgi:NDP-sugar pyrophosphorylase family protein